MGDGIKLFVSDLDGTLLTPDFKVGAENVAAIHSLEEADIAFAVATGRIYQDAHTIFEHAGIKPYIISNNGACAFNREGEQLYGRWIPMNAVEGIVEMLEQNGICYGLGGSMDYVAPFHWRDMLDAEAKRLGDIAPEEMDFAKRETYLQNGFTETPDIKNFFREDASFYSISVVTFDPAAVEKVQTFVADYPYLRATVSSVHGIEIVHVDATKDVAVAYLANLLETSMENVAAIGDGLNDLEMIQAAGLGIAVGNAADEVKKASKYITETYLNNGVAAAIKQIIAG